MLPAGAAESNRQIAFAFVDVMRQEIDQQIGDALNKFGRLRKRANVFCDLGMASSQGPEFGDEMGIWKKTNVEHQVRVVGDAVLESEAHERNQNVPALFLFLKQLDDVETQVMHVKFRSVNDQVGHGADVMQMAALSGERCFHRRVCSQGVRAASLTIATQQDRIRSFEKD